MLVWLLLSLTSAFVPPSVYERPDRIFYSVNVKPGPSGVADILDSHNAKWLAKGYNTSTEIAAHNAVAREYLSSYWGLNYSNSVYNSTTDITTLLTPSGVPYAISVPYGLVPVDDTYRVQLDWPRNMYRTPNKYYRNNFGTLVRFMAPGTFTSGNLTGQNYKVGDVAGVNVFYILKKCVHCPGGEKLVEHMTAFSTALSPNTPNGQNVGEQVVHQLVRDSRGRLGGEQTVTESRWDPVYGNLTVTNTIITFAPWIAPSDVN